MSTNDSATIGERFEALSEAVTSWAGSTSAVASALGVIAVWLALGPVFRFSDTWQLVINTGTTIVTFLMVFLIQRSQNKGAMAIHLKLDELVAAVHGASNRLIDVEGLTERELIVLRQHYHELANLGTARKLARRRTRAVRGKIVRHGRELVF
jgi:low affinity Fe/Cu permease